MSHLGGLRHIGPEQPKCTPPELHIKLQLKCSLGEGLSMVHSRASNKLWVADCVEPEKQASAGKA